MRLVSVRQEALYRGFRIEAVKAGECLLLRVIPTKPNLPSLIYSRFLSLPRGSWSKALEVVCGHIDEGYVGFSDPAFQAAKPKMDAGHHLNR
jgi:hypothetical protein